MALTPKPAPSRYRRIGTHARGVHTIAMKMAAGVRLSAIGYRLSAIFTLALSVVAALGVAGCGDLAAALPPRPTPFPVLAHLPSVTPVTPSPTSPATATPRIITPTPTPDFPHILVPATANMRSGPGIDFMIVAVISPGSSITLSRHQGDWYEVRTDAGQKGWISNLILKVDPAIATHVPLFKP